MAVDAIGDRLDATFHRIAELYLGRAAEIVELWNSGPRTLVHGDPHLGNLFVDVAGGDRTGFLDWAMLGRSPGLRDVAYVLCNSIPAEVRERERARLDRALLRAARGRRAWSYIPTTHGRSTDCSRSTRGCAATSTAGMGSKWQPLHIGLGGTHRATAACDHLGCVELIDELLR